MRSLSYLLEKRSEIKKKPIDSFMGKAIKFRMKETYMKQGMTEKEALEAIRQGCEKKKEVDLKKIDEELKKLYA